MQWWNSLTKAERAQALEAAGWVPGGTCTPSAADAWTLYKKRMGLESLPGAGRTNRIAVGDLAKDVDAYFETFGSDANAFIKCSDCDGKGHVETNGPEWVGPVRMENCETCGGTGRVRDANDDEIEL